MYWPSTLWTWSFFGVASLQAIICLALESYVFGKFEASLSPITESQEQDQVEYNSGALTIPTYLTIFIFGFLYQLVLVWDALRLKNTIQVIGICIYNLGMMIYAAVQIDQVDAAIEGLAYYNEIDPNVWPEVHPFLVAAPCILAVFTLILSFVAWKLYAEFAWTIYKHISADLRLKRRYLTYQIYIAFLKFDFFFFLGFTVQFLVVVGSHLETYEFALTIAALPITVVLLFLAAYFTRLESYVGQSFIIFLDVLGMAYFTFKLVRMYDGPFDIQQSYNNVKTSLTTFAVLTILLLVATIATAVLTMMNFNKGLKPHIQKRKVPDVNESKYGYGGYTGGEGEYAGQHQLDHVGTGRMTID